MKQIYTSLLALCAAVGSAQSFNNQLNIPYLLTGKNISLRIHDSTTIFYTGFNTNTVGFNSMSYLGPTLVLDKDSTISFSILNQLADTTTVHWHGLHVPAIWDGGPMNPIAPGQTWSPQFKIMNEASTMWYHSHMHEMTLDQVTKGQAGMIIIRDTVEQQLNLPRTYGLDDIPVVLQDREFDGSYQLQTPPLGSLMVINGTVDPYLNCPAQVVRLRVLNGSTERSYQLGFSDNRNFMQIGTDGGLLETPAAMNRLRISPGERAELLLDFNGEQGDSLYLMNYGLELGAGVSGGFHTGPGGGTGPLDSTNVQMMKIRVTPASPSPVTVLPSTLVTVDFVDTLQVSVVRKKILTSPLTNGGPFTIDSLNYDMSVINDTVLLGATEIWEIQNKSILLHPMHIHDIQFNVISRSTGPVPANEKGWKDVVSIAVNETVRVATKFADYADPNYAYMFHCHLLDHEDDGMMHQFIVINPSTAAGTPSAEKFALYPNPTQDKLRVECSPTDFVVDIYSAAGNCAARYERVKDLDVSTLPAGLYFIRISSDNGYYTGKFVKE
jgi:blue copper oxidase